MTRTGIYAITCLESKKMYIGKSKSIHMRWSEHRRTLDKGVHANSHLQAAWNLYGKNSFVFSVLEDCTNEELASKEIYWTNHYEALDSNKGYNMVKEYVKPSGEEGRVREEKMVVCIEVISREIIVLESAKQVAEILPYKLKGVQDCLSFWKKREEGITYEPKKTDVKTVKGFIVTYLDSFITTSFYFDVLQPVKVNGIKHDKRKDKTGKPMKAINVLTGEVHEFFTKKSMCRELNLLLTKVHNCLDPESTSTQHRGFRFETINN